MWGNALFLRNKLVTLSGTVPNDIITTCFKQFIIENYCATIVVLRPNLSQKAVARAILNAFHYSGRPYDFNFDFRTDSELVCSELIFKAYQTSGDAEGLSLPLSDILGRPIISPNEIAELSDKEYGLEEQQFVFVAFLDGSEKELRAIESNVEQFRQSWKRPKWSVWIQENEGNISSTLLP